MYLHGTNVVEWAEGFTAPFAARILADLGATVVKVEPAGVGDYVRHMPPFGGSKDSGALFSYLNAGKRSVALTPADSAKLRTLIADADVLIIGQPDSVLAAWGIDRSDLQRDNPALVILSLLPFGLSGPAVGTPNSELTLQHHAGIAHHQARPVADPNTMPPVSGADHDAVLAAGISAAGAALWGLLIADRAAKGPVIDMSVHDFFSHLLFESLAEYREGEREFDRERKKIKGTEVAGGLIWILPCSDGWVMTSPREAHQWERWIELIGSPAWSKDAELCGDRAARKKNWGVIQSGMAEWTRTRTRAEVFEAARAAVVPCFPVSEPNDLLANAQLAHRRFFNTLRLPSGRTAPVPGLPFIARTSNGEQSARAVEISAPALGEANGELFASPPRRAAQAAGGAA